MADEDRPKPPSIEPPKIVPGKETARSIGIDTAFIDGLAAGLVDEADLPPPPVITPRPQAAAKPDATPKREKVVVAKKAKAPPKKPVPARKPPPPRGLSERSEPLFRVAEVQAKDDDDPLAALLELPAETHAASGAASSFVAPKPRDDLLSRLAADDDDGAVSALLPPPKRSASESSGSRGLSESSGSRGLSEGSGRTGLPRGRSESSGNVDLPKGPEAPEFDPRPKAEVKAKDAEAPAEKSERPKMPAPKSITGKREAAKKDEPKPAASKPAPKPERAREPAPLPSVATTGGALENVHPGMWFLLAAAVFGLFVPMLAGGFGAAEHTPIKSDAARRAPATAPKEVAPPPEKSEGEGEDSPVVGAVAGEEQAEEVEEEELVEIEEEELASKDASEPRKSGDDGDAKVEKTASQLLTEAKAAYSQGRNSDAYKLAGASNRQRASEDALIVRAKAACRMGNEDAASRAFEALPMGEARRDVRPVCRDKGIHLGI